MTTAVLNNIQVQEGLNEVVINKVQQMIENRSPRVQETIARLISEGNSMQDYIAPIGVNLRNNDRQPIVTFGNNGHIKMNMPEGEFNLHDNAITQLGSKMGIPTRYLRDLARGSEWQKALATIMLNEHSSWTERTRVLIRTVGQEVRGVLSDSYRRLNSVDILSAFIQEASHAGAAIADAHMSDTKVWAETILPTPLAIPTRKNGDVVIYLGARFSTSDFGDGAVDMRAFLLNGACLNGMVRESVMKQVHLGSKLPDNLQLSDNTYRLDTETTISAVKDLTKGLYSKDNLMEKAIEIQLAGEMDVDLDTELKQLVKKGSLLKSDGECVEKILMNNNPEDGVQGGATLWKLTQAITAHSRDLEPARSRDLQEIAGALMSRVKISSN